MLGMDPENRDALAFVAAAESALPNSIAPSPPAQVGRGGSSAANAPPAGKPAAPVFQSLFSTEGRRGPVAGVVASLWSTPNDPNVGTGQAAATPSSGSAQIVKGAPLDLFQDLPPNVRALFDRSA